MRTMHEIAAPTGRTGRLRITVTFPASVADALHDRAIRDLRPAKLEVVHLVSEALRVSGDLPKGRRDQ